MATLPNEILLVIFSSLQPRIEHPGHKRICEDLWNHDIILHASDPYEGQSENYKTLCSICQSSKQFRTMAQPLLYHTLSVMDLDDSTPLLKTLCKNPHLGKMIKELNLRFWVNSTSLCQDKGLQLFSKAKRLKLFSEACTNLKLHPEARRLIHGGLEGSKGFDFNNATLGFWLVLTPNLVKLNMELGWMPNAAVLHLLRNSIASLGPESKEQGVENYFPFLREIHLQPLVSPEYLEEDESQDPVFADYIRLFSKLPSIKELYGYYISWPKAPDPLSVEENYRFEHIHLDRAEISPDDLMHLLRNCRNLRSLRLDLYIPLEPASTGTPMGDSSMGATSTYDDLGGALRKDGGKLESLDLGFYCFHGWWLGRTPVPHYQKKFKHAVNMDGKLGSLRNLHRLRHLKLPLYSLLGLDKTGLDRIGLAVMGTGTEEDPRFLKPLLKLSDVLPDSLESLELRCEMVETESVGENLCGVFECERLSRLRSIVVSDWSGDFHLPRVIRHLGWAVNQDQTGILRDKRGVDDGKPFLVYTKT